MSAMPCPLCECGATKVLRTVPGSVVSRQHECLKCAGRWWSDQQLRAGSIRASEPLPVAQGKDVKLPSSLTLELIPTDSDPNPSSLGDPNRAGAREAELGPAVFTFPVSGDPKKPTWAIRFRQHEKLLAAFPGLDITEQYRKCLAWLEGNPKKTARGMMAFLFRWMNTAQNMQRANGSRAPVAVREEQGRKIRDLDARAKSAFGG